MDKARDMNSVYENPILLSKRRNTKDHKTKPEKNPNYFKQFLILLHLKEDRRWINPEDIPSYLQF
jgi:hypothetical protein